MKQAAVGALAVLVALVAVLAEFLLQLPTPLQPGTLIPIIKPLHRTTKWLKILSGLGVLSMCP